MNRTLRTLALPTTAALMLSGCSMLPFEIVPKGEDPPPTAEEATPTQDIPTEVEETQIEVEETQADEPVNAAETQADGSGPNYTVGPEEALSQVVAMCDLPDEILLDDGMTLILDNPGEDSDSGDLTPEETGCVIGVLELPAWIQEEIKSTTALDGRQKAVDGYVTWSWTYSAGDGLDFLITVSKDEA